MTTVQPGGAEFARMIEELRRLQHRVAEARPPAEVSADIAGRLAALATRLEPHAVAEADRLNGRLWELAGRGQAFIPPITVDHSDDEHRVGRLTFGPTQLGAGGVVHGGSIPLVFVEFLGLMFNVPNVPVRRLAYLHVDFKAPVPIGVEAHIEARLLRSEGRKLFVGGALRLGSTEAATAEALFLLPR
jgi:acyl-coenzyme A thioesterase PaaI-like protein